MNTENHLTRTLRERLRTLVARTGPQDDRPEAWLAMNAPLAEWRALEALVSAGERVTQYGGDGEARVIIMLPPGHLSDAGENARITAIAANARAAVLYEKHPLTDPDQVPRPVASAIIIRALRTLADIAREQGRSDRRQAYSDAAHDLENHPSSGPADSVFTAVSASESDSPEQIARALRDAADNHLDDKSRDYVRTLFEGIAKRIDALPLVTITMHLKP